MEELTSYHIPIYTILNSSILIFSFIGFYNATMLEFLKHIDTQLLLFLNSHNCPFMDKVMWLISERNTWLPLYLIMLGFVIYKYKKQSWIILLGIVVLIVLSDQISSGLIKPLVERLRPSHDPMISTQLHIVNNYRGGLYGFVSSHASNTFAIAVFLSLLFKRKAFTVCILIWAAIVSFSRIYLGVHYPGDVMCGALLGTGIGFAVMFAINKLSGTRINKTTNSNNYPEKTEV
jgi:undecaprenyl-diphosphatase